MGIFFATRKKPVAVVLHTVAQGTVESTVSNTRAGTVKACRRSKFAPAVGGQVAKLALKEGDFVKQGQVLLELWNKDLDAERRLAESQVLSSRASREEACLTAERAIVIVVETDMSKFPNEKHFSSWLGLTPKNELSGGKLLKSRTIKTPNRAGQAFRMAAGAVMRADCAFGTFYRRQKARLGPAQATVATVHLIARVVYRMLKYQVEYEPLSVSEYEKRCHDRQVKNLEKNAAKFGFQLAPAAT